MRTVSVVMATYNGEKFIREQLDSILAQDYPLYEIIVQDDGSIDNTMKIVQEYAQKYNIIKLYANERNLGYNENFRTVILRATGDYVALSDQDDVWYPQKISKQMKAIGDNDVCYSQHHRGVDKKHLQLVSYKCAPERQMFKAIVGHSMLIRREFAQDQHNWLGYMAYDIGLSIFAHFGNGITMVEEPLNWHRTHSGEASMSRYKDDGKSSLYLMIKPYVNGLFNYFKLQRKGNFRNFYTYIRERNGGKNVLVNELCCLLLSNNPTSIFKLCYLCMKHRHTIYSSECHGIIGLVRGFCFPFIHSYHCDFYD